MPGDYPQIYHELAIQYPCSADDLFSAAPFAPAPIIEQAAKMFGQGMLWWQIKTALQGCYEAI